MWYWRGVLKLGSLVPALALVFAACTPPPDPISDAEKNPGWSWMEIDGTNDSMLITVGAGRHREAVIDVPWTDKERAKGVADGFKRASEAKVTRAQYRFDCDRLMMSMYSFAVLSEKGETLASQVTAKAKPYEPKMGATGARYLVAACEGELAPVMKAKLAPPVGKP